MTRKDTKIVTELNGKQLILDLADFPHGALVDRRKDDQYDIEFYSVPESMRVPSYDPASGRIVWMPVKCWSVHRGKKLEIVTLSDGSQIFTDDDPRAIYGVSADADTCDPQRFRPDEAVARGVLVPLTTDSMAVDCSRTAWYDFDTGIVSSDMTGRAAAVDFEFGQFVGIMAGDGWSDSVSISWLADNEGYNIDTVSGFLGRLYDGYYSTKYVQPRSSDDSRYGDTTRYRLCVGTLSLGSRIKELVDGHGDDATSGSANKRLPIWYQFAGRDFILGLVNGLIATDGSVSVSHSKKSPQLQIQFSSTSLRLAREFQRCCRLLGCRCRVHFSKATSGGNSSWLCIVSTVDAKRVNLLDRCCHARKRDTFINTPVSLPAEHVKNDLLPFPKSLSDELVRLIPAVSNPKTTAEREQHATCINIRRHAVKGRITRHCVGQVVALGDRLASERIAAAEAGRSALDAIRADLERAIPLARSRRETRLAVTPDRLEALRGAVEARLGRHGDRRSEALNYSSILSRVKNKGGMTPAMLDQLAEFFDRVPVNTQLQDSPALARLRILAESEVRWETIESVEKTGVEEVGYDLTVPGYDTFVNADGVVLSNTMNFHVPASEKAVRQAIDKMLPSSNLFSTTDLRSPRYVPMMEMTMGLAKLTAKPSGRMPRVFRTKSEAIQAYRRGEFAANDPVIVGDM